MQRKLIVDRGNTLLKAAIFEEQAIVSRRSLCASGYKDLTSLFSPEELQCTTCIYSSVAPDEDPIQQDLANFYSHHLTVLEEHTPVPITTSYDRRTLGSDRLAAVVGAYALFPNREVLIIDAGTAITYERLSASGCYLGGTISPGARIRFEALHHYTARLPLIEHATTDLPLWGQDTASAIHLGVVRGILLEMEGYISLARKQQQDLLVLLTGGAMGYFEKELKCQTFAVRDLVLQGLNCILDYQYRNA